eukprot:CAMPEP_0194491830 /NCGR_PEP_ID=MMETSP0253-20130528/10583_1 /TAXON_ID=2966 /ORGANISM="Noctiluca scintillans" /LENGTH=224 /DNA_ID=CAMNT_0039332617 /DNA_START=10 /DNA_END=684 /DNA_ORIENTATION=+
MDRLYSVFKDFGSGPPSSEGASIVAAAGCYDSQRLSSMDLASTATGLSASRRSSVADLASTRSSTAVGSSTITTSSSVEDQTDECPGIYRKDSNLSYDSPGNSLSPTRWASIGDATGVPTWCEPPIRDVSVAAHPKERSSSKHLQDAQLRVGAWRDFGASETGALQQHCGLNLLVTVPLSDVKDHSKRAALSRTQAIARKVQERKKASGDKKGNTPFFGYDVFC